MSCGCENRKRMEDLQRMRGLARKAARMEGCVYVLFEKNGAFGFVAEKEEYDGNFIEYIWY